MRKIKKRKTNYFPDPKFNDPLVMRFVNHIMKNGNKSLAYKIFCKAMKKIDLMKVTKELSALSIWKECLKNVMPHVEVRSRRVGGINIQVPTPIIPNIKITKAMKLLIKCARARSEKTMVDKLALEILAASKEEGNAVKTRENIHKMAEANKAFSHFRF